ncbi:MAG: GxxExxY protein [Phycisphaerales bacterium]
MPNTERRSVRTEDLDPQLTEVSRKVIGSAIEVHKSLGPGFDLSVYEKALGIELEKEGVSFALRHRVPVAYKGEPVGEVELGMYVNDRFAVQLMAERREIDGLDRTALRAQLRAADLELGLIINFAERRLKDGLVRVLNPDKLNLGSDDEGDE